MDFFFASIAVSSGCPLLSIASSVMMGSSLERPRGRAQADRKPAPPREAYYDATGIPVGAARSGSIRVP